MNHAVNWKRVGTALWQFARSRALSSDRVASVLRILPGLITFCGSYSRSRKVALRVGRTLIAGNGNTELLVPTCPAFSHRDGKYTYKGLGQGVPLLVKLHIPFLQGISRLLEDQVCVRILLADQEASVGPLAERIGIDETEFRRRVQCSITASRRAVRGFGWQVEAMTDVVPDFSARVEAVRRELLADESTRTRIRRDVLARERLYDLIGYPKDIRFDRSAETLAQYVTLGRFAAERDALIANHTTSSLDWYRNTDAGLLHNPVRVY